MNTPYEPGQCTKFIDRNMGEMLLYLDRDGWYGWLFRRHVDGHWVSVRKASNADLAAIKGAVVELHPPY